jgi:hypothetical protein
MSMTLAPRRRAIFNRRGRVARNTRRIGFAAAVVAALSLAFTAGMKIGAQNVPANTAKTMYADAANSH